MTWYERIAFWSTIVLRLACNFALGYLLATALGLALGLQPVSTSRVVTAIAFMVVILRLTALNNRNRGTE